MKAIDKILKARSILVLDHPFFGSLALHLKLIEKSNLRTAAVNGKELSFNAEFINSLTIRETVGVMAHEVMHLALGHGWRRDEREIKRWNVAIDYTVNGDLIQAGFTLPSGALIDPVYDSMSAEEIYEKIPPQESGKDNDPGGCGGIEPIKNKKEAKETKATWQTAVAQAVQMSQGELPASIEKQLQEILNPSIPWYILLRDFVERNARNDYDWTRPSRRYIRLGVILPSLISEQLPEVIIAIDTSGSIDTEALSRFSAEASNVLGVYDTTIRVIYCDAKIRKEEVYTRADLPMKLKPVGGGGTNFRPVFDYIQEKRYTPACLIYFTDLYGRFPEQEPGYSTMWLTMTKDKEAPFGVTVKFK